MGAFSFTVTVTIANDDLRRWIAGALNSAWRAVFGMLIAHPELNPNPREDIIKKFLDLWGHSEEYENESLEAVVNLARTKAVPIA